MTSCCWTGSTCRRSLEASGKTEKLSRLVFSEFMEQLVPDGIPTSRTNVNEALHNVYVRMRSKDEAMGYISYLLYTDMAICIFNQRCITEYRFLVRALRIVCRAHRMT